MYRSSCHQHYPLSQQQLDLAFTLLALFDREQEVRRRISPWCVYCWGRDVQPLVLRCEEKPCHWQCQVQTSQLDFGPRRELTMQKQMTENRTAAVKHKWTENTDLINIYYSQNIKKNSNVLKTSLDVLDCFTWNTDLIWKEEPPSTLFVWNYLVLDLCALVMATGTVFACAVWHLVYLNK